MAQLSPALETDRRLIAWCDRINEFLLYAVFFFVPIIFTIYTRDQFELPKLTLLRILTGLMLGVWGVRLVAARRWQFLRTPLDLPILVWFLLQVLTTFHSVSSAISWRGEYENFRGLLTVGNYAVLYYLAVHFLRTRPQIQRLISAILLSGLVITFYGIAQFLGVDFIAWNPASISPGRYFSTLGNPNFLSAYLSMVMPLVVVLFVETSSAFRRGLLLVCFVVMFFALTGTWSRGGFLGLVAALGVLIGFGLFQALEALRAEADRTRMALPAYLLRQARNHPAWMVLLSGVLAALLGISATFGKTHMIRLGETIFHFKDAIKVSRLHIWGPALGMIRENPWLGTGLDTFKTVFPRYATPEFAAIDGANVASRTAHNEILQVLATQGVIGLVIVLALTLMILRLWFRSFQAARGRWQDRLLLIGLLAAWAAYSAQNLFSFGVAAIDTFYWLIPALFFLLGKTPEEQTKLALSPAPEAKPTAFWAALSRTRSWMLLLCLLAAGMLSWLALKVAFADYAFNVGSYYQSKQAWDPCLAAYTQAATLEPDEVKYIVYEGLAYEEKAKATSDPALVEKAIAAYRQGIRLNPTNAYYLANLGRAYSTAFSLNPSDQDAYRSAISYFREAVRHAPVTLLFYQNLAMTYLMVQDDTGFQGVIRDIQKFDPASAASLLFSAGNAYYQQGNLAKAQWMYGQALALNPGYVEAHFNLGVALARQKNLPEAVSHWKKALELRPDFEPARQMLERSQASGTAGAQSIFTP